jgi:hypothetical protein
MPASYSFLIALEVLADLDVGVLLKTALIFDDDPEIRREDPALGQVGVPQVGILVRIAAQVVLHRKLRLEVSTQNRGTINSEAEDRFVELPFDRHQLAVGAERTRGEASGKPRRAQSRIDDFARWRLRTVCNSSLSGASVVS